MKNLYERLKPEFRTKLNESVEKYNSVSRLKYTLMSKHSWHELTIENMKDLFLWANITSNDFSYNSFCYGKNIIEDES
jgi:hypothetical protein|tara:strand:+ start:30 stop:263 length:234 start_codon:yes stop_codon:yes gene_type:complete